MIGVKENTGNPFEESLDPEAIPQITSAKVSPPAFVRVPIVVACTAVTFILLIAGTATTAISYPPQPPQWKLEKETEGSSETKITVHTALDGDYKLLGPLLIMAGGFLLIVDIALLVVLTKDAYYLNRTQGPNFNLSGRETMSILGGPFVLAVPSAVESRSAIPFAYSRQLWAMPNAPMLDFASPEVQMKGSRIRPATTTLARSHQPPFNPDVETPEPSVECS